MRYPIPSIDGIIISPTKKCRPIKLCIECSRYFSIITLTVGILGQVQDRHRAVAVSYDQIMSTLDSLMITIWKVLPQLINHDWLVVLTILKHITQWEGLSHILRKMKDD